MSAQIIDGKQIALDVRAGVAEKVAALKAKGITPCLAVVLVGNVLFRAGSLAEAGRVLAAMAVGWRFTPEATLLLQRNVSSLTLFCLGVGIVGSLPVLPWLKERTGRWGEPLSYAVCAVLLVLCVMDMAVTGFQPFIYLQF